MDDSRPSQDELQRAMRFASSPEAQQLKNLLPQSNAQGLKTAMEQAAKGDLSAAKASIERYLATNEAQELLKQLRNNP